MAAVARVSRAEYDALSIQIETHASKRDPETGKRLYSDQQIATMLGVHASTVARHRKALHANPIVPSKDSGRYSKKRIVEYLETHPLPKDWSELQPEHQDALLDFYLFNELFFPDEPLYVHEKRWWEFVTQHPFWQINAPPRFAKSHLVTVRRSIWRLAGGGLPEEFYREGCALRDTQVMIVQRSEEQAKGKFLEISAHLTMNQRLLDAYGRFQAPGLIWQESKGVAVIDGRRRLAVSGDYSLQIIGAQSAVLGRGAHDIIADDPFDRRNAKTPEQAEDGLDWLRSEVFTRREPERNGTVGVLGAKLPLPNEPYTQIASWPAQLADEFDNLEFEMPDPEEEYPRLFTTLVQPAVLDWEKKETLCPEKWPWQKLMAQRRLVGKRVWNSMYDQNPEASGIAISKREWIYGGSESTGCLDNERIAGVPEKKLRNPFGDDELLQVRCMSVDSSQKKYWGVTMLDVPIFPSRIYHPIVLDLVRDRLQVGPAIDLMKSWKKVYNYQALLLEENGAEHLIGNETFKEFLSETRPKIRLILHKTTGENKPDPLYGIQSLGEDFEAGRVRIPNGDTETRWKMQYLIKEALAELATDDTLISLWMPKWNLLALRSVAKALKGEGWPGWEGVSAHITPPDRLLERVGAS